MLTAYRSVAFAKANLAKGTEVKQLWTGRGGLDLLKNPAALEKLKVGEFQGAQTMAGHLTNRVYKVRVAGPADGPETHIVVRVGVVQPNDGVTHKYVDLGVMPKARSSR